MPKTRLKILSIPWWMYMLMGIIGIIAIITLNNSYKNAVRMNSLYAPLINASVEVELNVTMAHLLVEEILNGDHFQENEVWENYTRADWYVQAMLKGGTRGEEVIQPMEDPELRLIIQDLRDRLTEFKTISKERLSKKEISGPGTKMDQRYNQFFAIFLKEAKGVKKALQHVMTEDLERFRVSNSRLMTTGFFLALFVAITLYRLEGLRAIDYRNLQSTNKELENEIVERIRAEKDLLESREQLRKLSHQLQTIRETEKTRIAREVHDELGQRLTALKMELSCLENDLSRDPLCLSEKVESMEKLIEATINSVRRIATELRPQILDICGLLEALEWQARDYQYRFGIVCELDLDEIPNKLDPELSTSLFRIFQETLTNVARHAKATRVNVSFRVEADHLILTVRDNGVGINPARLHNSASLGLLGIQERVHFWNGLVTFSGEKDQGTTVAVKIPLKHYEPIR